MAIQYDLLPGPLDKDGHRLYPRYIAKGTIPTEKLVKWMSQIGGLHPGQIHGVLTTLTDAILDFLQDGYDVQIGELGYLSVSLTGHAVQTKKEIRAESIRFKTLNFRPGTRIRKRMTMAVKERVPKSAPRSSTLSKEDRIGRLKEFLGQNPFITRTDYSRITGLLKDKALEDLKTFIQEGMLRKYGAGRTVVYLLAEEKE
jgi:hypothetical protein